MRNATDTHLGLHAVQKRGITPIFARYHTSSVWVPSDIAAGCHHSKSRREIPGRISLCALLDAVYHSFMNLCARVRFHAQLVYVARFVAIVDSKPGAGVV